MSDPRELFGRFDKLSPTAGPLGRMNAAQMLTHIWDAMLMAIVRWK